MTNAYPTPQPPKNVSKAQIKRWRRHLADERMEARTYRSLAERRTGSEREVLLKLAEAERRHEEYWLSLLGDKALPAPRPRLRTRLGAWLAHMFGTIFILAMAQRALAALLGLIGEDGDFLALAVLDDPRFHGGALDVRRADFQFFVVMQGDDLIKGHGGFLGSIQLFHEQNVAVLHFVLLAAGFDDGVHDGRPAFLQSRCPQADPIWDRL